MKSKLQECIDAAQAVKSMFDMTDFSGEVNVAGLMAPGLDLSGISSQYIMLYTDSFGRCFLSKLTHMKMTTGGNNSYCKHGYPGMI